MEHEPLPYEVERLLATIIEKELRLYKECERIKADIVSRFDFTMQSMFREIDDWSYKYIDIKNLKRFLMKTNYYPEENLLKAVLRRLDSDGDGRLSY